MSRLVVDRASLSFGGVRALQEVELAVGPGEILGIIGPNGAGKTTLLNAICGLHPLAAGDIRLEGASLAGLKPSAIARRGLGRTYQTSQLFRGMTVLENVMSGLHVKTQAGLFAAAFSLPAMRAEEAEAAERARIMLAFVGMERFADRMGHELSFGQQRLVEIARTLISEPSVVLLDEPAVGLSITRVAEFDRLVRRIRDERGVTLLIVEHVIRLVMEVSDRIAVLNYGRKIAEGSAEAICREKAVVEAYLGKQLDARRQPS